VPDASCTAPFAGAVPAIGYRVSDALAQNATSTITVTVNAPLADTAAADTSSAFAGVTQSVNPLSNDTAPAGVSLVAGSVKLCTGVQTPPNCTGSTVSTAQGTYSVNGVSGVISFAPCTAAGVPNGSCTQAFTGTAAGVTYQVSDNLTTPRVVSSTYTPTVIAPPVAGNDSSSGAFAQLQTIDVLRNDSADTATTLLNATVLLCGPGDAVPTCNDTSLNVPGVGDYVVNANGTVSFTPASGYFGSAPALTYQVSDGLGQTTSADIAVSVASPTPPAATGETRVVLAGAAVSFRAITGPGGLATPGDGALVSASSCLVHPAPSVLCDTTVNVPGEGVWALDPASGVVTFTADPSAPVGPLTAIDYRVVDANGQSDTASLTPVIPPGPTAVIDVSFGEQGQSQSLIPAGNDTTGDASVSMDTSSVRLCDPVLLEVAPNCSATQVQIGGQGVYELDPATGRVTFTPDSDTFTGAVTPVSYQIADELGQVATADLEPYVLPKPAPHALDDIGSAPYGGTVTLTPLFNDTPGDVPSDGSVVSSVIFDTTTLALCAAGQQPPTCAATSVTTVDGTYTLDPVTLQVDFVPVAGFSGTVLAPVQYQIGNSYVQTVAGTPVSKSQVTSAYLIPSIAAPAPPAALDDVRVGLVNNPVTLTPIANDTDGQRDLLIPTSLRLCDASATPAQSPTPAPGNCTATLITIPGTGTLSLDPSTGVVTFTPSSDWTGQVSVAYVVADAAGGVVDALIDITINAPVALPDSSAGIPGQTQRLNPLVNDSAAVGTGTTLDPSSLRLCGPSEIAPVCTQTTVTTAQGTYSITGAGQVDFTPAAGFDSGTDSVDYVVRDSQGEPAAASLTITVVPPPVPIAVADIGYAPVGQSVVFAPWSNDIALSTTTTGSITYTDGGFTHSSVLLCASGESVPLCTATTLLTVDGSYVVDPVTGEVAFTGAPGFTGTATVPVTYQIANPYTVNAGTGSGTEFVSARLTPVLVAPPTPAASNDTGSAGHNQPVVFTPWSNDSTMGDATTGTVTFTDSGFDHLSVLLCDVGESVPGCTATSVTTSEGTYTVDPATGEVTFTPVTGFSGVAQYPVRYQIADNYTITNNATAAGGGGNVVSALLIPTIGALTPPTATNDATTTALDTPVRLAGAVNDTAGSYPVDVSSVRLCGVAESAPACTQTVVVVPEGTFTVDVSTGEVTFAPADGWSGSVSIPYVVADTHAHMADATLTVTITPPSFPAAQSVDDRRAVQPGTTAVIDVLANDTTDVADAFRSSTVRLCDLGQTPTGCTATSVVTAEGTWTVDLVTGAVSFTPAPGFRGPATIPYQVSTHSWRVTDAEITVWVVDPPAARDDSSAGDAGQTQELDPFSNDAPDSDAPFEPSSLRLCGSGESVPNCTQTQIVTPDGTYTIDPITHNVRFRPVAGFSGNATPVLYQVLDIAGQVTSAWLRPFVRAKNSGSQTMGVLKIRKVIKGGTHRGGVVTLQADCANSTDRLRVVRKLALGIDAHTWNIRVPAGMTCTVRETDTGTSEVRFHPTLNGKVWQDNARPRLAVGASKPIGVTAPIRAMRLSASGACSVEADMLIGQRAGECRVTWIQPGGKVTTTTKWTQIQRGDIVTGDGQQSGSLRIRAGQTTGVTFINAYRVSDQIVTRDLVVTASCELSPVKSRLPRGEVSPCTKSSSTDAARVASRQRTLEIWMIGVLSVKLGMSA
jgi:CshA-type fibril repeat protein